MADLGGTKVISPVRPTDSADVFATHEEKYGQGGYRTVGTIAERDAIPPLRRKRGMLVHVVDADGNGNRAFFELGAGLLNSDWTEALVDKATINALLADKADQSALDATNQNVAQNAAEVAGKAPLVHQHSTSDLTDFDSPTFAQVQTLINNAIAAASISFPAGLPLEWEDETPPAGTLIRNGAYVLKSDYPLLFDVLGNRYNLETDTDPSRFRLPDDRGKYSIGAGGSVGIGDTVGSNSVDLSHSHKVDPPPTASGGPNETGILGGSILSGPTTDHSHTTDIEEFDSGSALGQHDNRPLSTGKLPIIVANPAEFVAGVAISSGGASTFFGLLDTPGTGSGFEGNKLKVKADASGIEFVRDNPDNGILRLPSNINKSELISDRALSVGPVEVAQGETVTVEPGAKWVVV